MQTTAKLKKGDISFDMLKSAIERSWGARSSFDAEEWTPSNPAHGQCAMTALVVNDFFGGKFLKVVATYPNGKVVSHFYNELESGIVDLTRSQFPEGTKFSAAEYRSRERVLSNPVTAKKYKVLKKRVLMRLKNLSKKMATLYLAHPLVDRIRIRDVEIDLECKLGIELFNPFYDIYRPDIAELDAGATRHYQGRMNPDEIVRKDLEAIKSCNGLLAIIPKDRPSIGESMEIFYNSFVLSKPTYLIIEDNNLLDHPWLVFNSSKRFSSIGEFKQWWKRNEEKEKANSGKKQQNKKNLHISEGIIKTIERGLG